MGESWRLGWRPWRRAWGFTNAYEPRVRHFAGFSEQWPIEYAWTGVHLRCAQIGGVIDGEVWLKVWGSEGGSGQIVLCVDLRQLPPHPEERECRDPGAPDALEAVRIIREDWTIRNLRTTAKRPA